MGRTIKKIAIAMFEAPTDCGSCPCYYEDANECMLAWVEEEYYSYRGRDLNNEPDIPDWCPLEFKEI